jgi:hypothetical protein
LETLRETKNPGFLADVMETHRKYRIRAYRILVLPPQTRLRHLYARNTASTRRSLETALRRHQSLVAAQDTWADCFHSGDGLRRGGTGMGEAVTDEVRREFRGIRASISWRFEFLVRYDVLLHQPNNFLLILSFFHIQIFVWVLARSLPNTRPSSPSR